MSEVERRMGPMTRPPSMPTPESFRQVGPITRPPSHPLPATPDSFRRIDPGLRLSVDQHSRLSAERFSRISGDRYNGVSGDEYSPISGNRYSITPTPPPNMNPPEVPEHTLRRRPGGNLRAAETIKQLHPRPMTIGSFTSSISSYSLALIPDRSSNYAIPSISTESPQSLLETPQHATNRQSQSPAHRVSGLGMDFTAFRMPQDIESSDDENCDPAEAVEKTLLKLEGKYVRKNGRPPAGRPRRSTESDVHYDDTGDLYEFALSDDMGPSYASGPHDEPPDGIMIEREDDTRWARRHKHVMDGHECDTPTRHGPFVSSSLFEFVESPPSVNSVNSANTGDSEFVFEEVSYDTVEGLQIPLPTVESALAELERDRLEHPRIPAVAPPKPPEDYHRSLAAHLPFILQYDSTLLARQFTLIEKDILAEIDWAELVEPTWMDRNPQMVDVRDWKGFIVRDEGDGGLDTVVARFNLVYRAFQD
jgi:hypothetical protein